MGERSPYRSPVADRHNPFSGMGGMDSGDCPNNSLLELSERFSTRDRAPILRPFHLEEGWVAFSHLLAEDASLPLSEMDLAKIGFDDGLLSDVGQKRRRGLGRALKGRDVDGREFDVAQALSDLNGLPFSVRRQRRIALAVDERKGLAVFEGGRLTVANKKDLGRSRGCLERALSILNVILTHRPERSSERRSVGSFALCARSALACLPYVTPHRS